MPKPRSFTRVSLLLALAVSFLGSFASAETVFVVKDIMGLGEVSLFLYGTAKKMGQLAEWNGLKPPYELHIGQRLKLKEDPKLTPTQGREKLLKFWRKRLEAQGEFVMPEIVEVPGPPTTVPVDSPPIFESVGELGPPNYPPRHFSVGLGYTRVVFNQGDSIRPRLSTLTLKLSYYGVLVKPNWEWGTNVFGTIATLSQTGDSSKIRYYGANLRAGYVVPFVERPWKLALLGGAAFYKMSVENSAFGYPDLILPQFYPTLSRFFESGNALSFYGKYVPASAGIFTFNLYERELAAGISFSHPLSLGVSLSLGLDIADLTLVSNSQRFENQTTTLSFGLSF